MLVYKREKSVFEREINEARKKSQKVYILGAALGAVRIAKGLAYKNLEFDAFVVDKGFYEKGKQLLGKDILCLDDVKGEQCVLLRSIANYPKLEELKKAFYVIDEDVLSLSMVASDPFDLDYAEKNYDKFNSLYESLGDDRSRQVMSAYINQKITGKFVEMSKVWQKLQYFDGDFYDLTKVECIVDCGAFNGDSFLSFCNEFKRRANREYGGVAYLLEPDPSNQTAIEKNCKDLEAEVHSLEIGAWSKPGILSFQSDYNFRNAGKISDNGDVGIKADAIDHIVGEHKVGFIKMDIEGAELNALKGAEASIKKYQPILAICAYHKREDMIELSSYIKSICPEYRFYLRAYGGPYSIELVLFAVV